MNTLSNQEPKWLDYVRWELKWSALELLAVVAGLYLLLRAGPASSGLGSLLLAAVALEAFAVRSWRYGRSRSI
jgi:hypothetical protein